MAFDVLDLANMPNDKDDLAMYGAEEIKTLTQNFEALLNTQECDIACISKEWLALKLDT